MEIVAKTNTGLIPAEPIPLDFAYSNTAAEIDKGIRDTIKGIRLSILAMGIGLARIKKMRLYVDLNFRRMNKYIEQLCVETRMERSGIFNWLSIGETYLKYRSDLEEIGFNDSDGPTKLLYLNRALETKQKQEVFGNIKDMSVREFKEFSRGGTDMESGTGEKITMRDNELFIDGKKAITINYRQNSRLYSYFKKVIIEAGKALEEGGVILPVRLHNMDEAHSLDRAILKFIERKRAKLNHVG